MVELFFSCPFEVAFVEIGFPCKAIVVVKSVWVGCIRSGYMCVCVCVLLPCDLKSVTLKLFFRSNEGKWSVWFFYAVQEYSPKLFNHSMWEAEERITLCFMFVCVQVQIHLWKWACPAVRLILEIVMTWSKCWRHVRRPRERDKPLSCYRAPRTQSYSMNTHLNTYNQSTQSFHTQLNQSLNHWSGLCTKN